MSNELREHVLGLRITLSELYFISRKAKALGMSRPNLIITAVMNYEKNINEEILSSLTE